MGSKLKPADEELYRRTDEVLHYLWDPIGVAGYPGARDEYYGYLATVFNLLKTDAGADKIAAYLAQVASEHMELPPPQSRACIRCGKYVACLEKEH